MNNLINNISDTDKYVWTVAFLTMGVLANVQGVLEIINGSRILTMENVFSVLLLLNNLVCCFVLGPQFLKGAPYICHVLELSVSYWVITNMFIVMMISVDQFYVTIDQRHKHLIVDLSKMGRTLIFMGVVMAVAMLAIISTPYPSPGVWALCTFNTPYTVRPFLLRSLSSCIVKIFFFANLIVICALNVYITEVYAIFFIQQYRRVPGAGFLVSLCKSFAEVGHTSRPAQLSYGVVAYCLFTQYPAVTLQSVYYLSDFPVFCLLVGVLLSPYLFVFNNRQQLSGKLCTYFPNPVPGTLYQNIVMRLIHIFVQREG